MIIDYLSKYQSNLVAIVYMIFSTFFVTVMIAFIKYAQNDLNVYTVSFFRFFLGLLIILPFIIYSKYKIFSTPNLKLHLLRSCINLPAMYLGFGALTLLTLEKISALHFIAPLFVTILAIILLKEKIYLFRVSSLVIGFIGMLIVIRPGFIAIDIGTIMSISSAFFWAFAIIITKKLAKKDNAITILSYQYIFMTLFTFIVALFYWQTPSLEELGYLFLAALSGTLFHLFLNHAYKLVDLTLTTPFTFLGLLWGSLFGYLFFNELPDLFTWIGGIIIFSSVLLITIRESQLDKDISKKSLPLAQ